MTEDANNKIDQFLLEQMDDATLFKFKLEMADNEELAMEVKRRKMLFKVIDAAGDLEIMEDIKEVHEQELLRAKVGAKRFRLWPYAVAAAIILVLGFFMWNWPSSDSTQELYAEFYEPYALSFTTRNSDGNQKLAEADLFYKSGKYKEALPLLEDVFVENPDYSKIELAIGICKMEIGQYEEALEHFSKLGDTESDLYSGHGCWYAALAELQLGNIEAVKKYLQRLIEDGKSSFYDKAVQLNSDL